MIVTYETNKRELTPEEKEEIKRAAKMPIIPDEDCPVYTYEELKEMYERTKNSDRLQIISLRVKQSTLNKAKSFGKGYTNIMSKALDLVFNDPNMLKKCI